ncbi:MAG TPA: GatB/YqeY domain-containing protein [Mycobacteriales bacterium]|nr:GatB/YqeY domain-containing protein [Mycobacteriales bacterium]
MAALKDRLQADLTAAMKARNELTTATLRMLLTAVGTEQVAGKAARELSDEEVLKVVAREAKKRREAATAFRDAGRADRAERELAEEQVLAAYLPAQLADDELAALVRAAVAETGAAGPRDMGVVMKAVVPRVAGRADGARVSAAVKAALAGG